MTSDVSLDKSIALYVTLLLLFFFKKSPLLTSWIESWPFLGICVRNKEGEIKCFRKPIKEEKELCGGGGGDGAFNVENLLKKWKEHLVGCL